MQYFNLTKYELIVHLAETSGTMQDARLIITKIKPTPRQFVILADRQSAGQGRNNSSWLSPAGGLWFTYGFRSEITSPQVALLAGLCLHDTLTELYPGLTGRLSIKWPNDLLYDGNKLAGILIQALQGYLCLGVGLNTNNQINLPDAHWQPVGIRQLLSFDVSNSALLYHFLESFQSVFHKYAQDGFGPFQKKLIELLYGRDEQIVISTETAQGKGICRGLANDGALLLEALSGQITPIYAGSVLRERD
jgi:BirA family transcriptional regulator, biotin operon repressor / biotin---[acetyl-CoA-carboxylase] ligase